MEMRCPVCGEYYKIWPQCLYGGDQSACQECIRKEKEKQEMEVKEARRKYKK